MYFVSLRVFLLSSELIQFEIPGFFSAYGIFTEIITAPSLSSASIDDWTTEQQIRLVSTIIIYHA